MFMVIQDEVMRNVTENTAGKMHSPIYSVLMNGMTACIP